MIIPHAPLQPPTDLRTTHATLIVLLGTLLSTSVIVPAAAAPPPRACSVANDEIVRIASWDLAGALAPGPAADRAAGDVTAMLRALDAEVVALQGLPGDSTQLAGALRSLRERGRCYGAFVAPGGLAILFDAVEIEALDAEGAQLDCRGRRIAPGARAPASAADRTPREQFGHFRARDPQRPGAFDFALLNADVGQVPAGLEALAARFRNLDREYPWLAAELDRIVVGDLAVDPALLTRSYFPEAKPLVNLLLKVSLGLSTKTFDEAVAAARSGTTDPDEDYDNILVRRWDQPGRCPEGGAGYCGGLEEFIGARVYSPEQAGGRSLGIGKAVHAPVMARFCKFADSDPVVAARRQASVGP
jgi:hypothetical protein